MIGHFFMRYKRPLAYMVTKLLADRIHRVIVPRQPRFSTLGFWSLLRFPLTVLREWRIGPRIGAR